MEIIKIWNDKPSDRQLDDITSALRDGQIMIFPTDTLYAIGCDALNQKAIEKVCKIKGINPEKTNLSIICSDISQASEYVKIPDNIFRILKNNTPGPFTFILKAAQKLPRVFRGRKTVGIRIPRCNTARAIADYLGNPLLCTSIEFEDKDYAVNPELIGENYEHAGIDLLIEGEDGGTTPSAIIDCTGDEPETLREGPEPLE